MTMLYIVHIPKGIIIFFILVYKNGITYDIDFQRRMIRENKKTLFVPTFLLRLLSGLLLMNGTNDLYGHYV